jgi:N-acetylglucosamine-6-phosphate deacetylase
VDLHFHGALFSAPPEAFAGVLVRAADDMLRGGTTAFLATTVAWSRDSLAPRVERLAEAVVGMPNGGASCLGLHLEGPWISQKAPGALSMDCLRPFEPAHDTDVLDRAGALLRMVTLAPEIPGSERLLAELRARGAVAALGHTRATPAQIQEGIERGLTHVTHLFNAMGPMHHREPGVPGTVLASDELSCDLICDGHHVDPAMVRLAARAKRDRLMLISDRVELPEGRGSDRTLPPDEPVRLPDGTLAGSRLSLDRALHHLRDFAGLDLREAVAACTSRPARLLGVEAHHGTLRRGARADLAVLDAEGRMMETWLAGRRVWSAEGG